MADTYSTILPGGTSGMPANKSGQAYVLETTVDFSNPDLVALNSGSGVGQNDVLQLIQIPANTVVMGVFYEITTASSNLDDFDIGDGDDVDGWHDGVDVTSTGDAYNGVGTVPTLVEAAPPTFTGYAVGRFYTSADTIDGKVITADNIVDGVITVKALCIPFA